MSGIATAIIGTAAVGAAASIYGGKRAADATNNAASAATDATIEAAQIAYDATIAAQELAIAAQEEATEESVRAAEEANQIAIDAVTEANRLSEEAIQAGADFSNEQFQQAYNTIQTVLNPWIEQGNQATERINSLMFGSSEDQQNALNMDPGYQFRLDQGEQALERSAASKGSLFSGKTGTEISEYAQDYASSEFDKAYSRLMSLSQTGQSAANTLNQYTWDYGTQKANNEWTVQNNKSQNAMNMANTKSQGAWNISSARAGGAQKNADVVSQGASNTANVTSQNAYNVANATANEANANATAVGQQWSGINNAMNSLISTGATLYGVNNKSKSKSNNTMSNGSVYGSESQYMTTPQLPTVKK